jgi:transcriptional regulator with PAS, ATPase and Fis domain
MDADTTRKYLKEYHVPVMERNLPVVMNKTVEQAERELIYRALVDLKGSIIDLREMMLQQGNSVPPETDALQIDQTNGNGALSLSEMERRMIVNALERHKGNRRLAARDLNISERTLYRKIKEFGLHE